jgi:hypothetical protein
MELTIETGIAMPKNVRKNNGKESKWVKLFNGIRPTLDTMEPNQSFAFNDSAPIKTRRDLIWVLNKYGLKTGKRFGVIATEPKPAEIAEDGTITVPAIIGSVRVFCLQVGLEPEAYEAGQYEEKFTELFADAAEVVVPETKE